MGFTVEDMMTVSEQRYKIKLIAGGRGWSNSISWILMLEDTKMISNFSGKEFVVTMGMGFDTEEKLLELVDELVSFHAAGLLINHGYYLHEIPESVIRKCDENDFPLLTAPWDVRMSDMIKDLTVRIFLEETADNQISQSLICAIENPQAQELYRKDLLPYFDEDGTFQVMLISDGRLDVMDTVERRRLAFGLQIFLENITHNGNFFYYDNDFVLVVNSLKPEELEEIAVGFNKRRKKRMAGTALAVSIGSVVTDISNLYISYNRAKSAMRMALSVGQELVHFDEMGIERLLYSVADPLLTKEMGEQLLEPILSYDKRHDSNYLETLECYLQQNGSIQAVAEELYAHRNTIIYRINNIKKLLECNLERMEDRLQYLIACRLVRMTAGENGQNI